MAAGPHTFVTLDVFTAERYLGSPLAVVSVRNDALSRPRKQRIAREFGFCTTAFLHDAPPASDEARRIEIFTPSREQQFSAEAVLGAALYIFQKLDLEDALLSAPQPNSTGGRSQVSGCTLDTKAGLIHTQFDASRQVAVIEVPHEVHVHAKETPLDEVLAVQKKLLTSPDKDKMKASYPIVSISQGETFTLVDFTNCPALLAQLAPGDAPDPMTDAGWRAAGTTTDEAAAPATFSGSVYFIQLQTDFAEEPYITRLRVRMITHGVEEAVTPAGCCALAAHLALQKGEKGARYVYAIEQGVEMDRRSQLCVEVRLNDRGSKVSRVTISGRAVFITEGRLL